MVEAGLDHLTVAAARPPQLIDIAAAIGVRQLSLYAFRLNHPDPARRYSLVDDPALLRETRARLADSNVFFGLLDSFVIQPEQDPAALDRVLDLAPLLGIPRINAVSLDPDRSRTVDRIGALAERAATLGLEMLVEPCPTLTIATVADALELIAAIGDPPHVRLLIDMLHMGQTGMGPAQLAAIDPARIGYVQMCDGPAGAIAPQDYLRVAASERLLPGEGALPLAEMLAALPPVPVGAEIPMARLEGQGVGLEKRAALAVSAARAVVAAADRLREAA